MPLHRSLVMASAILAALAVVVVATSRPIIGILAQEVCNYETCGVRNQTYIAASYVKFVEQAGARVAPIFILLPGGDVDALNSSYGRAGTILYHLAMEAYRNGTHFPLWGTCLGLELLARVAVGGEEVLTKCQAQGVGMPLNFTRDFRRARLFRSLPQHLEKVLSSKPMTYNAHYWCLTLKAFKASKLDRFFKILSTNNDLRGVEFVSSLEAISAPVFAVQFHPEMAVFEWGTSSPGRSHLYHNKDTALFSQYLANFFVEQGIVSQHLYSRTFNPNRTDTYIAASYVKFIEASGGRAVPIFVNQTKEYYKKLFNSINGVLLPGGEADLESSGYLDAAKIMFDLAIEANKNGTHFPLWGTCLGFEALSRLAIDKLVLRTCQGKDLALPLNFTRGFRRSRMFNELPRTLEKALRTEPITYNSHGKCLTPENFTAFGLDRFFRPMSTNVGADGVTFISSMEAHSYPFYGVQFHPEKNNFEWTDRKGHSHSPHTEHAVKASQYLGNFFLEEARKNNHSFASAAEELGALIYNYPATFTQNQSVFTQMYIFSS
ncbi:gamma-glutamyl hydrolase-like isoform X2 [Dermacentor andersoni]|uniref:gamma-glutamyl hydrolase-like isoform X2 n=1 Tax=Dermacentor andersoni TaxID=34620 RepID=UPI0024166E44|nr:gamma-glutamyl hydrolase-like isoform X2 [Dermacentor andersoni]